MTRCASSVQPISPSSGSRLRNAWRSRGVHPSADRAADAAGPIRRYLQAFFVSATELGSVFFLAALFPNFLHNERPLLPQFAALFATLIVVVGIVHFGYALFAAAVQSRLGARRFRLGRTDGFRCGPAGVQRDDIRQRAATNLSSAGDVRLPNPNHWPRQVELTEDLDRADRPRRERRTCGPARGFSRSWRRGQWRRSCPARYRPGCAPPASSSRHR